MMRCFQISALILVLSHGLLGQFDGSIGDGFSDFEIGPVRLDGIHFAIPFKGGSGDGGEDAGIQAFMNQTAQIHLFAGGSGDGFSSQGEQAFLSFSDYDGLFAGSLGDGHSLAYKQSFLDETPLSGIYSGASGDGFSGSKYQNWMDHSGSLSLYGGGTGDGQDGMLLQSSMGQSLAGIYGGASGDGHSVQQHQSAFPISICTNGLRILVDADAIGTMSGQSWQNAFTRLPDAIAHAKYCPTDELWVAEGIYHPTQGTDRTISLKPHSETATYGGFNGTEIALEQRDWSQNPTILSGNIGSPALEEDNSFHVVDITSVDGTTILDGFTIEDGNASDPQFLNSLGAGIFAKKGASNQNVLLKNLTIRNCQSINGGAAIYLQKSNVNVRLESSILVGNTSPAEHSIYVAEAMLTIGNNVIVRH